MCACVCVSIRKLAIRLRRNVYARTRYRWTQSIFSTNLCILYCKSKCWSVLNFTSISVCARCECAGKFYEKCAGTNEPIWMNFHRSIYLRFFCLSFTLILRFLSRWSFCFSFRSIEHVSNSSQQTRSFPFGVLMKILCALIISVQLNFNWIFTSLNCECLATLRSSSFFFNFESAWVSEGTCARHNYAKYQAANGCSLCIQFLHRFMCVVIETQFRRKWIRIPFDRFFLGCASPSHIFAIQRIQWKIDVRSTDKRYKQSAFILNKRSIFFDF